MATSVSKVPLFTSGEIRFSALRDSFRQSGTTIRASELRRDTLLTVQQRVPVVPDATENSAISTGNNLALSQFRNSIKAYFIIQDLTNVNLQIQSLNWNGNLNKSIFKGFIVNGIIGASSGNSALSLSSTAYNLVVNVNGGIYGFGGSSGGGTGGNAISISSTGSVTIDIESTGNVFAGGGGGNNGATGAQGPTGYCFYYTFFYTDYACGTIPTCGTAVSLFYQVGGGCNCTKKGCKNTSYRSYCRGTVYYQVRGGFGGAGGSGGRGRGYDYSGSLSGSAGSPGESPFCPNPNNGFTGAGVGSYGETGKTGGAGGTWGSNGQSGSAGRAVSGSRYTVTGSTGSSNIRGLY